MILPTNVCFLGNGGLLTSKRKRMITDRGAEKAAFRRLQMDPIPIHWLGVKQSTMSLSVIGHFIRHDHFVGHAIRLE